MKERFLSPKSEENRLRALAEYEIMDSPAETEFDELTRLASYICDVPLAQISLIDDRRQWFKSRLGFELAETPREVSFCHYTLRHREVVEIEDAAKDERFDASPLVHREPHARVYAGAPLITPENHALGALCVMDREPRKLAPDQRNALQILARQVVTRLELRRQQRRPSFTRLLDRYEADLSAKNSAFLLKSERRMPRVCLEQGEVPFC